MYLSFSLHQTISLVSAGILEQREGWVHDGRVISSFEIIIGVKGTLYITQSKEMYSVNPGNMLILLPGEYHVGTKPCEEDTSFYWLHFLMKKHTLTADSDIRDRLMILANKQDPASIHECMLPIFHPFPPEAKSQILVNQLLHVDNYPYYTKHMQNGLLSVLLTQLAQNYVEAFQSMNSSTHENRPFSEMLEWIRTNADQKLTVADVAKRFHYNDDYFSRIFCARTGQRFSDYVNRLRINKAKSLLFQTNLSVKEIAYQVGFTDEKYFMNVFKRYERITALQYRNAFYLTHKNIK